MDGKHSVRMAAPRAPRTKKDEKLAMSPQEQMNARGTKRTPNPLEEMAEGVVNPLYQRSYMREGADYNRSDYIKRLYGGSYFASEYVKTER